MPSHIPHFPVNTPHLADLMILTLLLLIPLCPSYLSIYLSAGPAGPAFISPPGEGAHPKQLQLYGAGCQPWECY